NVQNSGFIDNQTQADLSVTKTANASVCVGNNLVYTLTVHNAGPAQATSVSATDTLPAGTTFVSETHSQGTRSGTSTITWSVGTPNPGPSATMSIPVSVRGAGPLNNTASVLSAVADPNNADNSATATTTAKATPACAITAADAEPLCPNSSGHI